MVENPIQAPPKQRVSRARRVPGAPAGAGKGLSSVHNALRLLKQFTAEDPVRGVSELAQQLGMAKSTTHRLLTTLKIEGFVRRTEDGYYALGLSLWELGACMIQGLQLREVAHPVLEELRNQTRETTHLGVLDGNEVVYIDRVESGSMLTLFRRIGHRMPAHATSTGKAILAYSAPEIVSRVLGPGLREVGPRTITSEPAFQAVLARVRLDGYSQSFEESERGAASVGAPVFDHAGNVVGAVSVAVPVARLPKGIFPPELPRQVRAAADRISRTIGHHR